MYDSDAVLVESISACARVEATTAGQRLAAIAELATRRCGTELAQSRERWACDAWDSCAAEVAAELTISHRSASTLMHQGLDLRDRFPAVGALLAQGEIPVQVATAVTWRGQLIEDPDLLALIDAEIAAAATRFGTLSDKKLTEAIDTRINKYDPDAVRRFKTAERGLDVRFGKPDDETGTRSIYGRVKSTDAELMDRRAEALARSVCPDDPRTHGERRTEAFGIIAVGGDRLPCQCGNPECPAAGTDPRSSHVVIHVITNDPGEDDPDHGAGPDGPDDDGPDDDGAGPQGGAEAAAPERTPMPCASTAVLSGGGVIPAPLLAELRAMGAVIAPVLDPIDLTAVPGYRPSAAQQRFVRTRDITCCFPGCTRPAEYCDVDHTIPYAARGLMHDMNGVEQRISGNGWLRILDVPAALKARTLNGAFSVRIAVTDLLGIADGSWTLTQLRSERTRVEPLADDRQAEVTLDVGALSAAYLGAVRLETLAAAGRVSGSPDKIRTLSEALSTPTAPHLSIMY